MTADTINRIKVVLAEKRKSNKCFDTTLGITEIIISRWSQNSVQSSLNKLIEIVRMLQVKTKDLINHYNDMQTSITFSL